MKVAVKIVSKNGATTCSSCHTYCQGFRDPSGKILCWDCFYKKWGYYPKG